MAKKFVAYYRVSTQKQGRSGLGLEAQKAIVLEKIKAMNGELLKEFIEVESGKKDHRPELESAIATAKDANATLIIAKLDRLSRNVRFIFTLRDTKVDFLCCDLPEANTLTIGMFATMAQHERETISARTKAALAAKKARGFKLGKPENLTLEHRKKGRDTQHQNAINNENTRKAYALICALKKQGMGLRKIAGELNDAGFVTANGKTYTPMAVKRAHQTRAEPGKDGQPSTCV